MKIDKNIGFILSTGRTGTMFFEEFITQTSQKAYCYHEPVPSRIFIPLTNMYYREKISGSTYNKIYNIARKRLFKKSKRPIYIESSNFMWAGIPALNEQFKNIKILHLVRHPEDYIVSHYHYGFWKGTKRLIRKNIPYFKVDLPISAEQLNDPIFVLAARWLIINKRIASYQKTNPYMVMKFEDIFNSSVEEGINKLALIKDFFQLEESDRNESKEWLLKPKNISRKTEPNLLNKEHKNFIRNNLDELMTLYNYQAKYES